MKHQAPSSLLAKGYALLFALMPWSVDFSFGKWNLNIPSEPVMLLLACVLLNEIRKTGFAVGFRRLQGNLPFWLSAAWIGWLAVAALNSSMPLVSAKYWLAEAGQWLLFGVGVALFPALWRKALPWFVYSMAGVCVYTIFHHGFYHFRSDQAILAPMPFFPDHTMYAAVLVFLLFIPAEVKHEKPLFLLFAAALLLSGGRGAVLSAVAAGAVFVCWKFRKNKGAIGISLAVLTGVLCWFWPGINAALHRDVSYLERLNRWDCAASMLHERPVFGYGPGAYPFQFLPFQKEEKMTRISTHIPILERNPGTYGRGGSAHSEYWQAAAETGWPGLLIWCALVLGALATGFSAWRQNSRTLMLITLALLAYFLHAFLNNFLHDGRVAMLVWGCAMTPGLHRFYADKDRRFFIC